MSKDSCESKLIEGLYSLKLPVKYLSEDASDSEKETLELFKKLLRELNEGSREGIILPSEKDECGNNVFSLEYIVPN